MRTNCNSVKTWTPEMLQTLRTMVAQDYSAADIGRVIGVTRNAVIGQARRSGVKFNRSQGRKPTLKKKEKKPMPVAKKQEPKALAPVVAFIPAVRPEKDKAYGRMSFPQAMRGCQYCTGEPREKLWCGRPISLGETYCEDHKKVCYYKPKPVADYKAAWQSWVA